MPASLPITHDSKRNHDYLAGGWSYLLCKQGCYFLQEPMLLKLLGCVFPVNLDFLRKHYFCDARKMETNYDILSMSDLRVITREHGLRDYSRLGKAELITFLWDNLQPIPAPRPPLTLIPVPISPSNPISTLRPIPPLRNLYLL